MVSRNKLIAFVYPYLPVFFQLMRFGIVGLTAACIHFSIVVMLVEFSGTPPLLANFAAFTVSFQVSYTGHRFWTFRGTTVSHKSAFSKLLMINCFNFVINESLFYFFLNMMHLPYQLALFIVLSIMPLITFMLSKFWVFR